MRVGAAVGEGDELGEGVGALGAADEGCVSALRADEGCGGFRGGGGGCCRGAAEGSEEGHFALFQWQVGRV